MGRSGKIKNPFKLIGEFFSRRERNEYLEQHGYYESFDDRTYSKSPESFPHLPFSLQDMLEAKKIAGRNVLVATHRSTALWFRAGKKNAVTLARPRRGGNSGRQSRLRHVDSYKEYDGAPVDILVWDSHVMPSDWREFVARVLSPRGVVIFVYSKYFDALENGLGALCDHLESLGMRQLEFRNPGPRRESLTAVVYYPRDNALDI
ncbi:MAG: hypothetical protein J6Y54_00840 [Lentisphaeria bacterium]|jgi:hypothetical protein|nr:hypothetical protein [Lentisphaeria bacterium]